MMVEDHPDWEMLLHAAAALRSGDHKPYRAMRRDWDHRASLMNPDSVAQTVAEWRLPFNFFTVIWVEQIYQIPIQPASTA